ncbi:hypothetical protein CP03DC29_0816B, partial [Chlamydia psittaci 03DC29]
KRRMRNYNNVKKIH